MSERNILWYCVILTVVFVAATLAGFHVSIPGKRELSGNLLFLTTLFVSIGRLFVL
jgi:hypothetical protein